jgi:hypothetical protein
MQFLVQILTLRSRCHGRKLPYDTAVQAGLGHAVREQDDNDDNNDNSSSSGSGWTVGGGGGGDNDND